eukprot:TRINITY_DN113140_c0_g1_i1.p1 TRINITY_DN113140_c0_g1~~TRINITY_DN113140_c0_g1_i1.p1  ORF type:complete len:765 (+),score=218.89 TRINITY_DN113140_c0_g1_i1:77-2371(+)
MGCGGTKQADGSKGSSGGGADKTGDVQKALTAEYTLGEVLGQGAFGVVYACKRKGDKDFTYAVKMVDKVDTPVAEIKKEAEMMKELEHACVVKYHNLYYEKCFVCIVMDAYKGGDLIECMQLHWKSKGKIPPYSVVHIVKQMAEGIAHIHSKMYVHRDIKGDNYLTDRTDITDTKCRVLLSDFGTAVKLASPTQRLKSSCGTKIYWPPEFYDGNYSFKVDCWAMGVIMFGLCDGRFPFKGESDSRRKPVKLPQSIPSKCQEFVLKSLEKEEAKRFSASEMLQHPWITENLGGKSAPTPQQEKDDNWVAEGMEKDGANGAQDERRKELLERLDQKGKKGGGATQKSVLWNPCFEINDKRSGKSTRYEWRELAQAKSQGIICLDGAVNADLGTVDVKTVERMLQDHNIDTSKFGTGEFKTVAQFASEVHKGSAILMLDAAAHKKLVRVVDVVLLRIAHNGKYLLEVSEVFSDGRQRDNLDRLPGTKKDPHENTTRTASRVLADLLNMTEKQVTFDVANIEIFEQEEESRSFPGVVTVYRKEILECKIATSDPAVLQKMGLKGGDTFQHTNSSNNIKIFKWMTEKECKSKGVKLRAPAEGEEVSGLVQAPIGMSQEELVQLLQDNKVDHAQYGSGNAKSIKDFSNELIKGEAALMVNQTGKLVRIVDVVLLIINKHGSDQVLIEASEKKPSGQTTKLERLPGTKRRPDENQFVTAQRVLKKQLKMDPNCINMNGQDVQILEEEKVSPHYPGLTTVYRKRIIKATLTQ